MSTFFSVSQATSRGRKVSLSEGQAARNTVLSAMESGRAAVLTQLREEAERIARTRPDYTATVNDIRHLLAEIGYEGDSRILGAVFRSSQWNIVGEDQTDSPQAHARPIRRFRLITGAAS